MSTTDTFQIATRNEMTFASFGYICTDSAGKERIRKALSGYMVADVSIGGECGNDVVCVAFNREVDHGEALNYLLTRLASALVSV